MSQLEINLDAPLKRDVNCRLCKLGATVDRACLLASPLRHRKIMVVLDAPSEREQKNDEIEPPELLVQMLEDVGLDTSKMVFCYAVSCATDKPTKAQIRSCRKWLDAQIAEVSPKFVLIVGNTALQGVMDKTGIKNHRGRPVTVESGDVSMVFFPVYSPSYVEYDPRQEIILQHDLQNFADIVEHGKVRKEEDLNLRIVTDWDTFDEFLDDFYGLVSYDLETSGLYPWEFGAEIMSLGFGTKRAQWTIPLIHDEVHWTFKDVKRMMRKINWVLKEGNVRFTTQNGKFDFLWTWVRYGYNWLERWESDTMLMHYMIDENSEHGLKFLSKVHYNAPDYDVAKEVKQFRGPLADCCEYQGKDLLYTRKLHFKLRKLLDKDPEVAKVYDEILFPCAKLFTRIEYHGVYINLEGMEAAEEYLRNEIAGALAELKPYGDINWGSPKQLGKLLFTTLKIPSVEKTKTGADSCSESVLKRINHPIAKALLRWRAAQKQLSAFIEGWKPFLDGDRIHPSFKLHGTVTGRLSCEHPNLQQVPRDPRIRSLITAPEGYTLLEVDLSQIELRIAAELANEKNMLRVFHNGEDAHWLTMIREMARGGASPKLMKDTASTLAQRKITNYGEAVDIVFKAGPDACAEIDPAWKELRKKAKAVNFGYLFGMWWKKFMIYARDNYDVIVTEEEAQESRINFFDLYPGFEDWHEQQRKHARRYGFVRSLSGRKRRLPAAMAREKTMDRMEAERQAINSPVQSFANELNLMSLLQLSEEFPEPIVYPVATVHDACLIEVRNDYLERVHNRMLEIMRWPKLLDVFKIKLSVPLEADAKVGPWGKGMSLSKWKAATQPSSKSASRR